jgi:hypothetical protein
MNKLHSRVIISKGGNLSQINIWCAASANFGRYERLIGFRLIASWAPFLILHLLCLAQAAVAYIASRTELPSSLA